jgi:hypothetical protein
MSACAESGNCRFADYKKLCGIFARTALARGRSRCIGQYADLSPRVLALQVEKWREWRDERRANEKSTLPSPQVVRIRWHLPL